MKIDYTYFPKKKIGMPPEFFYLCCYFPGKGLVSLI